MPKLRSNAVESVAGSFPIGGPRTRPARLRRGCAGQMHAFVSMLRASEARAELEAIQFAARDGAVSQMCHAWNVATTIALNSLGPRPIPPACRRDLADFNVDAEMRVITLAIDARLWTLAMDIMRWVDSRVRRIVGSIGRSSFSASELEQLDFKMVVLSETAGIFAEQAGRGWWPDVTGLDEAGFAREETMIKVFLPLLSGVGHRFFAASSAYSGSVFSALVSLKYDDGTPILNSLVLGDPCDACKAAGCPESCNHNAFSLPPWKDPQKIARLGIIYDRLGRSDDFNAELLNITKTVSGVFPPTMYSYLFRHPRPMFREMFDVVYVAIDPAAGGESEFAMVALAHTASQCKYQVIAIARERIVGRNHLIEVDLVEKFMTAIKTHPRMGKPSQVPIIVAIESCDGHVMYIEPTVLSAAMRLGLNVKMMTETHNEMDGITKGVPKTDSTTAKMVVSIGIAMDTKIIGIAADCVSVASESAISRRSLDEDMLVLERQLAAYRLVGNKYTGKTGGKNDDLLVAFMMAFYWSIVFCHDEKRQYAEFMMLFPIFKTWDSGTVDGLTEATREVATWKVDD